MMINESMKNFNMQSKNVFIFMFAFLVSFCLKETAVPIKSAFSIKLSEGEALSVMIQLKHLKLLGMRVKVILDEVTLQLSIISSGKRYNFMR